MKRLALAISLFAGLATTQCFGQTAITEADIPFAFEAGQVSFPAGKYKVTDTHGVILVQQQQGSNVSSFTLGSPLSTKSGVERHCLRFRAYGSQYFLSEIWSGNRGEKLPMDRHERLVAQAHKPGAQTDIVAVNRTPR